MAGTATSMQDFRPITWDLPLVRARGRQRLGVGRNDVASGVIVGGGVWGRIEGQIIGQYKRSSTGARSKRAQ